MADEPVRSPGFSTRALRAASRVPRVLQAPNAVPIYQAVTYSAEESEELGAVLQGRREGYAYSRLGHPTATILADAIATLEGGEAG